MTVTRPVFTVPGIAQWRRTLAAAVSWDALRLQGLAAPNPYRVLAYSSAIGFLVVGLWMLRGRLGPFVAFLFIKEGPLENLTFLLELVSAGLCAIAASRWRSRNPTSPRAVSVLYALCALMLFLVGMEEINWGQTLLGFETPQEWAKINYQHETSLHNLADRATLTGAWKIVAVLFGAGVLISIAFSRRAPQSIFGAIAPPPSLAVLGLIAAYSGARLHPEMIELLLSVFFAFYSYRIYFATRSTALSVSAVRWRALRFAVAAALVGVLLYQVDWAQSAQEVSRISLWLLAGLLAAMILGLIVSAWKWSWALRMHELRYTYPFLLRVLSIGFFLNSFLPTAVGGDAYRVYRTLPRDNYRSRALSAIVLERAVGFLALLALGCVGALVLADRFDAARAYCIVLLALIAAGIAGVLALEHGWLRSFSHRWRDVPALNALHHNLGLLRNRRGDWLALLAGSFVFQAISIGIVFALFTAISSHATLAQCALITAAVGFAAALPISINGIGVMEGALVAASVALGLDYEKALIVAFIRRLLGMCLAILCGIFYLTELRQEDRSAGRKGFLNLLQAFWRQGFRGLWGSLQPVERIAVPAALTADHTEPDTDVPIDVSVDHWEDRHLWHTELLEYTHDAIIIWEMGGGGILYWNRAAEQLYGYSRAEAEGKTTHVLLNTQLAAGGGVNLLEEKLARYGIWVGELRHTSRDGRQIDVEGRLALLSQHNGRWLVLEVNRDIVDRKEAEAAREAMERQLCALHTLRSAHQVTKS